MKKFCFMLSLLILNTVSFASAVPLRIELKDLDFKGIKLGMDYKDFTEKVKGAKFSNIEIQRYIQPYYKETVRSVSALTHLRKEQYKANFVFFDDKLYQYSLERGGKLSKSGDPATKTQFDSVLDDYKKKLGAPSDKLEVKHEPVSKTFKELKNEEVLTDYSEWTDKELEFAVYYTEGFHGPEIRIVFVDYDQAKEVNVFYDKVLKKSLWSKIKSFFGIR